MSFLGNLLNKATKLGQQTHTDNKVDIEPAPIAIPYPYLQKYFQLFVNEIYQIKEHPEKNDPSLQTVGQILQHWQCEGAEDFSSAESSFTTIASFDNGNGGHLYHGGYVTHGKNGGVADCFYIVIASSEPSDDPAARKITPHFIFLGEREASIMQPMQIVHAALVMSQSELDGKEAVMIEAEPGNMADFISAFAYADIAFKAILAGEKFDADAAALYLSNMEMATRCQKFDFLMQHRTPHFFKLEIAGT